MNGDVAQQKSQGGRDVPYQLRPNKFIDRQMFVELLARLIQVRGPEKYIYISMGGKHLVDHYAIYRELGIKAQFSFDEDKNVVARQRFNRPTDTTICTEMNSSALAPKLDGIASKFPSKRNFVVWLDYTNTDRKVQLQEAQQILVRLRHGDVFRLTLNAEIKNLKRGLTGESGTIAEGCASKLREQLEDLMPTAITEIRDNELPGVLAKCVELVTLKAKTQVPDLEFRPVLITSYADGQRMLTVTCAVSDTRVEESFPNAAFKRWQFVSSTWEDIHLIEVPVLSTKERYKLDVNLKRAAKRMLSALRFLPADDEPLSLTMVNSYRKFHRFYPAFRHVDD